MSKEIELLKKKIAREEAAREEAEQLLEQKSMELYHSNEKLKDLNTNLEKLVEARTKKLQETELEYQSMVESINDMIFRLDMKGIITFTNQIALKIIGSEDEVLVGKNIFEFINVDDRKRIFKHFAKQYLLRNCINYYEVEIKSRFGHKIWLRLNVQFSGNSCEFCLKKQMALVGLGQEIKADHSCAFSEIIVVAHDISQQKIGQEKLEKSEKRYRELTESLPEMICEVDRDGTLIYANQFAISKFGYTKEEVLNNNFNIINLFPEKSRKQVYTNIGLIVNNGQSTSTEYQVIKKNGELLTVIVYTSPIWDQEKVVGLRGVMFDISLRKQHELEIAKNLEQQVLLSEISVSYNALSDFENRTNQVLKKIGEFLSVSRVYIFENNASGELTSNTYEWCNTGIDAQIDELQDIPYTVIPSWKKMLNEDGIVFSQNIEELPTDIYEILEPQGIKSILVLPLKDHGKHIGFMGFDECEINRTWSPSEIELLRTISNLVSNNFLRQRIQNELIESEKENRVIIDSIPDVIIHANSDGKIKSLKSALNSNLSNLIKSKESATIFEAFNETLSKRLLDAISECLKKDKYQFEFKNLNWDEFEYYEARLVKLLTNEVLIIIRDVTVIKENEKQLQIAKNKAEEASKMKSQFLANVSHEIRTPLNAILGFSQWLFENTDITLHKGYLSSIINSGRNLLDVINDILDLSKLETGSINIELNPMNYREVISDVKLAFQEELERKGLHFNITTDKALPNYILMDDLRFYQIIYNLVSNSVKFTEKGYIHVLAVATQTNVEGEIDLRVSIEDTGIGIQESKLKSIFESFAQEDGQSTRNYDGTGLGLAIVEGLLKKMNGSVQVSSKEGKGTTFTITFSGVKVDKSDYTEKQLKSEKQQPMSELGPCKIMIVDDIDFNIEVLKALINSDQATYIDAFDGNEALAKLQTVVPDIIFMDIRMPGIDGFEVTRIIRNDEKLKDIPIIAFSASTIKSRKDMIELLFDDFLQKPVFKNDVEEILRKYMAPFLQTKGETGLKDAQSDNELTAACLEKLPEVIQVLEQEFLPKWETIKDGLVIYEVENFKSELSEMAYDKEITPISEYCVELELGLQSFDIELIEKRLSEFPKLIENLKAKSI
ncbi:PAS domain S-box protein [uncultured Draconibacterium sp.]|uniref:PAS domain S-box protein n=1 Tax=uncultured Draconibacterium sp. TaxID=1573823 RepID=UPI00321685C0